MDASADPLRPASSSATHRSAQRHCPPDLDLDIDLDTDLDHPHSVSSAHTPQPKASCTSEAHARHTSNNQYDSASLDTLNLPRIRPRLGSSSASRSSRHRRRRSSQHKRHNLAPVDTAVAVAYVTPPASGPPGSASAVASIPPASPEVISSLITSLTVLSPPSAGARSSISLPVPHSASSCPSPRASSGSFGVDYGAYKRPDLDDAAHDPVALDDLAACPPVVRTAKPPSGLSALTASSPASRSPAPSRNSSNHDNFSATLRSFSFIRTSSAGASRPSSRGSFTKNDDAHSIGNLSVEPASVHPSELKPRRSLDSWGKKAVSRGGKGLMYMTSKERLRDRELDRRRASAGSSAAASAAAPRASAASLAGSVHSFADSVTGAPRPDPFLAETPISEEPASSELHGAMMSPDYIPSRDSSLRNTTARRSRSDHRRSSRRDSERHWGNAILEADEHARNRTPRDVPPPETTDLAEKSFLLGLEDEFPAPPRTTHTRKPPRDRGRRRDLVVDTRVLDVDRDDSAPYPSVSSGRRRDEHSKERSSSRLSGTHSPRIGPTRDTLKLKRSSSRLKRLSSGPLSPRSDLRLSAASPEPPANPSSPAIADRPGSADSVDDAVESYLCSPRLSQKIRHPQTGRVISFSEVGDANGSAVFCCVGMGLTRYITAFYDELALTLKLRLITPDRPGVGDSEPYSDGTATPLSWPDDVYAICQALKITKFSILAHSAGAIYALATALRMPQHIRGRIHLLAPWIPPSQMNVFGSTAAMPPTNAIPTSQKILRALPTPILKAANSSFMTATSSSITSSLPKNPRRGKRKVSTSKDLNGSTQANRNVTPMLDPEGIAQGGFGKDAGNAPGGLTATENMDRMRPPRGAIGSGNAVFAHGNDAAADRERQMTYDTRLTHAIWELATTGANPAVDLLVCLERRHAIGFRYVDITRPVVIHHGSRDSRVPVDNVKWLGKTMRRCEVRVLEGEGHGLMASATVMGSVLMEMSKEWEDWMRATGADGRKERERGRRATLVGR